MGRYLVVWNPARAGSGLGFGLGRAKPARADWDDPNADLPLIPSLTVDDTPARFTGLLDASGAEIWEAPDSPGFHVSFI